MFNSKPERSKMKLHPYPETFFHKKMQKREFFASEYNASLLKYFPKYYNRLCIRKGQLNQFVQSKVKQLKIVRHCYCLHWDFDFDKRGRSEKFLKKLLQSSRKTLESMPVALDSWGNFQESLSCLYFPKVKKLRIKSRDFYSDEAYINDDAEDFNYIQLIDFNQQKQKKIPRSYMNSWKTSRFVEKLEVDCGSISDLLIVKKMESSKWFLSCLKEIKLQILNSGMDNIETFMNILMELLKHTNFLRHVTHIKFESLEEKEIYWGLIQSLINCCPRLFSLSIPTTCWKQVIQQDQKEFYLDLSRLQNLQDLKINLTNFRIFNNGIKFPPSVRIIDMTIAQSDQSNELKEVFSIQKNNNNEMIEDQDAKDFESFEKYKVLENFFEKWRKLSSLRVLNLEICFPFRANSLKYFILPFLRAVPQLETLNLTVIVDTLVPREDGIINWNLFFSIIESIHSLKHSRISTGHSLDGRFSGSYDPQKLLCLAKLSSVEIDVQVDLGFDLQKFLNGFLGTKSEETMIANKSLKIFKLCLSSVRDFLRILTVIHSISHYKNLQICLQIYLIAESINDISSTFKHPIKIACNVQLRVHIYLKDFKDFELKPEQKHYFNMIFGQLRFTIHTTDPVICDEGPVKDLLLDDEECPSYYPVLNLYRILKF